MDAISPKHAEGVRKDFFALVSGRGLPPDMISKAVILSQGALWKHRMIREPSTTGPSKDGDDPTPSTPAATAIEARMLAHLLAIHEVLLQIGVVELAEAPPEDAAENDLAQRITAPFRRTLPALRIASKWLRANFQYVMRSHELETAPAASGVGTHRRKESRTEEKLSRCVSQFWNAYTRFLTSLWRTFPPERLPVLSAPLEEDVDMRGFLPLRQTMGDGKSAEDQDVPADLPKLSSAEGQVHPNEEQLMRIADLLDDAKTLASVEVSSLFANTK
jgi:protein SMG7